MGGEYMRSRTARVRSACAILRSASEWARGTSATVEFETLKRLLTALERHSVSYAIFGAIALNLHGLARFTEDLDVFLAPDPINVERLKTALRSIVNDPEIDSITAADLLGPYPAIQYTPPDGTFRIDILT